MAAQHFSGVGDPNGVVFGNPGDIYQDETGGANSTFWEKESGVGTNTGWVGGATGPGLTVNGSGSPGPGPVVPNVNTLFLTGAGNLVTDFGGGVVELFIAVQPAGLPEQWIQENVPAAQALTAASAQVSTNFDTIITMRPGFVVGIRTRLTNPVTAGALTARTSINGATTSSPSVAHTSGSNPSGGSQTLDPIVTNPTAQYAAGDTIGVLITTSADFEPNGATTIEVWLEVVENIFA